MANFAHSTAMADDKLVCIQAAPSYEARLDSKLALWLCAQVLDNLQDDC